MAFSFNLNMVLSKDQFLHVIIVLQLKFDLLLASNKAA